MLKDVVWGRNSLFTDPLNFGDPLDIEAAEHRVGDKEVFWNKGEDYIKSYTRGYGERDCRALDCALEVGLQLKPEGSLLPSTQLPPVPLGHPSPVIPCRGRASSRPPIADREPHINIA